MKMMKMGFLVVGCVAVVLVGMAMASDTGAQVKKSCSMCHSAERVCMNLGVKNEAAWKVTIKRMADKGARVSSDQVDSWAAYLGGLKAGSQPICD